ncbi:MAG: DNA polymerase III subunit gamma/tau [Alphaproteobacteria bacterium]|nr:DNA polymerase III subunit gamma/tau [Alphaproteobacteria bacterium]
MSETAAAYRVLARKYRPAAFADLIGQEALVRILTNAIRAGRIAHAFMLTGVRGVGKTTTARILARALNCLGPDGSRDGPAEEPCGVCEACTAIAADRHVDVIEMDAASHTGVDDVREIIEAARYRPVSARFKVYIVDEVHMLSRQAFNALLKTLEEPPGHVKFVFATTEIRKVPVTVLSRCQRFDLRRVPVEMLEAHFAGVVAQEGAEIEPEALARIARAADGSVRDGLSMLDQAIAEADGGRIVADAVNEMLGLADRLDIYDLFEALMRGEPAAALTRFDEMYRAGADPGLVLQDMAELVHRLTRASVVPAEADDAALPEAERVRGRRLAGALSLPALTRVWQLVLKGIQEVNAAPSAKPAFEMVLLRIAYAAGLPTPAEAIAELRSGAPAAAAPQARARPAPSAGPPPPTEEDMADAVAAEPAPEAPAPPAAAETVELADFDAVAALFEERREPRLHSHLVRDAHLVSFEPGRIALRLGERAPSDFTAEVARRLTRWTGAPWTVSAVEEGGGATLAEQHEDARRDLFERARQHPLAQRTLEIFPDAAIADIRPIQPGEALAEPPEEQDDER